MNPLLVRYCTCGHGTARHGDRGHRRCLIAGCSCLHLVKQPVSLCQGCNHTPALHHPERRPQDSSCTAIGCPCPRWTTTGPSLRIEVVVPVSVLEMVTTGGVVVSLVIQP